MARVLVLGGYGVFGGRLARRLAKEAGLEVLVAGRSRNKAEQFCHLHGGTPLELDRDGDLTSVFLTLRPDIVVDAAGPFQIYFGDPYRVAEAAILSGAHYVDLADDTAFVVGIGTLNAVAREAGVSVISGASSVPAISSAALDELVRGLSTVSAVRSAILPGNRAPRGLSVVKAILAQVGKPLSIWRGGRRQHVTAWGSLSRRDLTVAGTSPLRGRLASPIGAPDLALFADRYRARNVGFEAGLELKFMHVGLWLLSFAVRFRLLSSLLPLANALKWIADRLEPLGSDRGGMIVRAAGRDKNGVASERTWTLIAEAGDGPEIPATPAFLLVKRLLDRRERCDPGAYPAMGVLSLAEVQAGLDSFLIRFDRTERSAPPLLERVLPSDFASLPSEWRGLAEIHECDVFAGEASVERGDGLFSRIVSKLLGFPPATDAVSVEVTKSCTKDGERWTRRFDGRPFVSHLSHAPGDAPGLLRERFGPLTFLIQLTPKGNRVEWPVRGWRFLGLPMPAVLMPKSETSEYVVGGLFHFDVGISMPLLGQIIRYRGWLRPVGTDGPRSGDEVGPTAPIISTRNDVSG